MHKETILDEVYHEFVNRLERDFIKYGDFGLKFSLSDFSKQEIDDLIWEIETEHDIKLSDAEIEECFVDALNYLDKYYHISQREEMELQCL